MHVDISRTKQCSANYSGDGPSSSRKTTSMIITRGSLQQQGFELNGIILRKKRQNAKCIVEVLSKEILSTRISNSSNLKIGDIVTEINEINIILI